jgi:hypothetical protein
MQRKLYLLLLSLSLSISLKSQPKGIYVLDSNQGTYRDANIRNYPFVDGFVWRTSWPEIETSEGVYNYAGIDHIVQKLDLIDKKLTVLFGAYTVEPSYIAAHPGVSTYSFTDPLSNISYIRAVPYDGYLLQRFRVFLSALANHKVYSKTAGTLVALKNHPVLSNIATNIPGLGAIRNVNGLNVAVSASLPGYSRSKFADSILAAMKIQTDNFPAKNVFIPSYKNINDNINSPALSAHLRTRLLETFNDIKNPKISFWQENLAGFTDPATNTFTGLPTTTFATPLYDLGSSAYTMFQMLQGWTSPFLDPAKAAGSTPFDAMCYAYKTYGALYFEVYVSDIDHIAYQSGFTSWDPLTTCVTALPAENDPDKSPELIEKVMIYPNPASSTISVSGIAETLSVDIIITSLGGQQLARFTSAKDINISLLPDGCYVASILNGSKQFKLKFIKQ